MFGKCTPVHRSQRPLQQVDDHRIELPTESEKRQQVSAIIGASSLCDWNAPGSRALDQRLSVKGPTGACCGTVECLGRQNSTKSCERPLPRTTPGLFTFTDLETISLLSNGCHFESLPYSIVLNSTESSISSQNMRFMRTRHGSSAVAKGGRGPLGQESPIVRLPPTRVSTHSCTKEDR